MPTAPPAVYSIALPEGQPLPPWAEPAVALVPIPGPGSPVPGRTTAPIPLAPVPEPSTWVMLLAGAAVLATRAWRR